MNARSGYRLELRLLVLLACIHLVPIWWFPYFPSQDGPAHLYTSDLLLRILDGDNDLVARYYQLNPLISPNWSSQVLLSSLMVVFGPGVAHKLLLSLYVCGLPLAVRYALRSVDQRSGWLAVYAFPFIFNWSLNKGFYNFVLSLPMFFVVFGHWIRYRQQGGVRPCIAMTMLLTVTYFCHAVSFVEACLGIGVTWAWLRLRTASKNRYARNGSDPGTVEKPRLMTPAFLLPAMLLLLFICRTPTSDSELAYVLDLQAWEVRSFLDLSLPLASFGTLHELLAAIVAASLLAPSAYLLVRRVRNQSNQLGDALLLVGLVYALVYLVAPSDLSGGSHLAPRLSMFPYFALMLWFATFDFRDRLRRLVQIAVGAVAIAGVAWHMHVYSKLEPYLVEFASMGAQLDSGKTLFPLHAPRLEVVDSPDRPLSSLTRRINPFLHFSGYLALQSDGVDLSDYQATTDYFPLRWRPEIDPPLDLQALAGVPPSPQMVERLNESSGMIDYVLIWDDRMRGGKSLQVACNDIGEGYEIVFHSQPRGYGCLYASRSTTKLP